MISSFVFLILLFTKAFSFRKYVGLQNLIKRNKQLYGSGNAPSGGVALPFILVQVNAQQSSIVVIGHCIANNI